MTLPVSKGSLSIIYLFFVIKSLDVNLGHVTDFGHVTDDVINVPLAVMCPNRTNYDVIKTLVYYTKVKRQIKVRISDSERSTEVKHFSLFGNLFKIRIFNFFRFEIWIRD